MGFVECERFRVPDLGLGPSRRRIVSCTNLGIVGGCDGAFLLVIRTEAEDGMLSLRS